MYKQKLYMLMQALEIQNIEELMEKPPAYLVSVGLRIAEAARRGAKLNGTMEIKTADLPRWKPNAIIGKRD